MAQKSQMINGHSYTAKMMTVGQRVRRKHDMGLRQYLAHWRKTHQGEPLDTLAAELRIDQSTLHDWLRRLDLHSLTLLVSGEELLRQTGQPVPSEVAAEAAEAERREAVAELTRMRLVEAGETEG